MLPPSRRAAYYHGLRVYYQLKVWRELENSRESREKVERNEDKSIWCRAAWIEPVENGDVWIDNST